MIPCLVKLPAGDLFGLTTAPSLFNKNRQVSVAEVAVLCQGYPIETMVKQISDALPGAKVMLIQQVMKGPVETVEHFKKFSFGV